MTFDIQEILRQLDSDAETYTFPMLDNGYYYHGDQKLTILRDNKRWTIILETLAYNNHEYEIEGITTIAYVCGNCMTYFDNYDNNIFFSFASDNDIETFLYDKSNYVPYLNPEAKSIKIKGVELPIIFNKEHYLSKGILFELENKITPWEFMRGLIPEKSNLFWVTRQEIAKKIPIDLPVCMTLNNWHHPDLVNGEKPSDTETFQQLAKVISTGDKSFYNTTEINNTHWSNWPLGGTL